VFTARYGLSPYIKQITFHLQRVKDRKYVCHPYTKAAGSVQY
jgi:hypothetical protein